MPRGRLISLRACQPAHTVAGMAHKDPETRREYERRRREVINADPVKLERRRKQQRDGARRRCADPKKRKALRDAHRRWVERNPGAKESARFKNLYGITLADYESMLEAQGSVCAICRRPEKVKDARSATGTRRLAVDHCHETRRVRGLLCWACNTGLAKFDEEPRLLLVAAKYLEDPCPEEG